MDQDLYEVNVLHFLNPHLIWVEVSNSNSKSSEIFFEQIGIFGILPLDTTLSLEDESLQSRRCEDWVPAACSLMRKLLSQADAVFFRPIHVDYSSSIFDNNIHKFGEIIIKKCDGKLKQLSKYILKSGFAIFDSVQFYKRLSSGKLKTSLCNEKTEEVIKALEIAIIKGNKYKNLKENTLRKQTRIFREATNLKECLTSLITENLLKHDSVTLAEDKVSIMLRNKLNDLSLCKDIEEESAGTGIRLNKADKPKLNSSVLQKKLQLYDKSNKNTPIRQESTSILTVTKQFLEKNAVSKKDLETPFKPELREILDNTKGLDSNQNKNGIKINQDFKQESIYTPKRSPKRMQKLCKSSTTTMSSDSDSTTRVVFGPPGASHLAIKSKPTEINEEYNYVKIEPVVETKVFKTDGFGDMDSEIDIPITNKENIKQMIGMNTNREDDKKHETYLEKYGDSGHHCNTHMTREELSNTKDKCSSILKRRLKIYNNVLSKNNSSMSSDSDTTIKDFSSSIVSEVLETKIKKNVESDSDEDLCDIINKLKLKYETESNNHNIAISHHVSNNYDDKFQSVNNETFKNNVNPFKNLDSNMSVFVDRLVTPVLLVHNKMNKRIQPCVNISDVNFNDHIHSVLRHMSIEKPMMLQYISWQTILRGYSLFMISPLNSGKTIGYVPAVCRLISDSRGQGELKGNGPTCIIVCATSKLAMDVQKLAEKFLETNVKILTCISGMDQLTITTSLLNGCDLLISTPSILGRLMLSVDYGIDLHRLSTLVLDDCERLFEVYGAEINLINLKIKEMLKLRVGELKVQYIAASRTWCDAMEPLAKKAPNSVVLISAFQECILYSKANMSITFTKKEKCIDYVIDFLSDIDASKKVVVVCNSDVEVSELEYALKRLKKVFACDSSMTVEDLYDLSKAWADYEEPVLGPILICCDGNLTHMNVTDAHYLIHFSLPKMFSMFCKRFSVLNDNYSSIFKPHNSNVKVKILFKEDNIEQLPKILHFVQRCTNDIPEILNVTSENILKEKDLVKAQHLVPVCNSLLSLGKCPDFWNCNERHSILKEFDEPLDWVPKEGIVTFKIIHFHSAVLYSVRIMSHYSKGNTKKYPDTLNSLKLKLGMFYGKETNQKLHGIPEVGDICAVSIKQDIYARCQVIKILSFNNRGNPNDILIKLVDKEKLIRCKDINLYYLPDDLKGIQTHVIQVRLAGVMPKDKDITFSDLAMEKLKRIADRDEKLYFRGRVSITIGNCIFVDTVEACEKLTSLNEVAVKYDFKEELLLSYCIVNPDHLPKLENMCNQLNLTRKDDSKIVSNVTPKVKELPKGRWAHIDSEDFVSVYFSSADNPAQFLVCLTKFEKCLNLMAKDIEKYIAEAEYEPITEVKVGDMVLAKFPDDNTYERARVNTIIKEDKFRCFFVDLGDYREILLKDLAPITEQFITVLPYQAIECRLLGVKPCGDEWTEMSINYFCDNCFEEIGYEKKYLEIKYFTKEIAACTEGNKYGVIMVDRSGGKNVVINTLMLEHNLAEGIEEELKYFDEADCKDLNEKELEHKNDTEEISSMELVPYKEKTASDNTPASPCSIPNGSSISDFELDGAISSDESDEWYLHSTKELLDMFKPLVSNLKNQGKTSINEFVTNSSRVKETRVTEIYDKSSINTSGAKVSQTKSENSEVKNVIESDSNNIKIKLSEDTKLDDSLTKSVETEEIAKPELKPEESQMNKTDTDATKPLLEAKMSVCSSDVKPVKPVTETKTTALDSDDVSTPEASIVIDSPHLNLPLQITNTRRKPRLLWRQNNTSVSIKILVIANTFEIDIQVRHFKFAAETNETEYAFEFEFWGLVDTDKCSYGNKGQYILVNLTKVLNRNWVTLSKDASTNKWISYDVDSIDTSSDDEPELDNTITKIAERIHYNDSESEDDYVLKDDSVH